VAFYVITLLCILLLNMILFLKSSIVVFQEQKAEENISNIKLYFFHKTRSKLFVVQYMPDVLTRFDIHDLSSLVLLHFKHIQVHLPCYSNCLSLYVKKS